MARVRRLAAILLGLVAAACSDAARGGEAPIPRLLFSTDTANGLIDAHGAYGQCAVSFSTTNSYSRSADVVPQDCDDGFTLALALNLEAAGMLRVEAVVPVWGNASQPAEMLVARHIVRTLKGREDLPIAPGATGPASQTIQPAPRWFDGRTLAIAGADGTFAAACANPGVTLLRERLEASELPLAIVAIGPLTDVACLLVTSPEVAPRIREVVVLASRLAGEPLTVNGMVLGDFNFQSDPVAGSLLLAAAGELDVPIRLMTFALTAQTSQASDLIVFDASTLKGPMPPTPASERSLAWLLASSRPREQYWSEIFGTPEGPFDQYALVGAILPELFDCRPGRAYVQMCPYPAWSPLYPTDGSGEPIQEPYNEPNNPCFDHGPETGASLSQEPAELIVTLDENDRGPLVRGEPGIDGNIPELAATSLAVTACIDFASPGARSAFAELLYENTW